MCNNCVCGCTCWFGVCSCNPCNCGCEGDVVSDECCLNTCYYCQVDGTSNSYVEFCFGYVLGTDSSDVEYMVQGVMYWYYGGNCNVNTVTTDLPSGACVVTKASAVNCVCSALDFQSGANPFYDSCNGGYWPGSPNYVGYGQTC